MKIKEILKFAKEYHEKYKVDGKLETNMINDSTHVIYCGDNLTNGFFMQYTGKAPNLVGAYSAFFLHKEMNPAAAERIAEETGKKLGLVISVQPGELKPLDAKLLETSVEESQVNEFGRMSVKRTYAGQLEVSSYMAVAKTVDGLQKAVEAVYACRNEHPRRYMVLEVMKKMPEWKEFLEQEYEND